jgi:hypothetical protein
LAANPLGAHHHRILGLCVAIHFSCCCSASCGSDQSFVYDLEPIQLGRAPITPGGEAIGGLLANVTTSAGIQPLLVDSAYPINSLAPAGCAGSGTPGWTYTGNMDLRDGSATTPVRASFDNVGLFDLCPGPTGDAATQPAGVMGGPLLANFSVGFVFPRSADPLATMSLWPSFPGSDDQLTQDGFVPFASTCAAVPTRVRPVARRR